MLQQQIIIHSIIYYLFDENIWSDEQYDKACNELARMKKKRDFKKSKHYEDFKDFDGSTGYHLVDKFKIAYGHKAYYLLNYCCPKHRDDKL